MRKTAIAAAFGLAFTAGAAQAQNVTLFGLVDTGVEYVNNIGPGSDSVFRMPTIAGSFASRWGIRGSEDLGGGLKALFHLEGGFGADSGVFQQSTGSLTRIFGRQQYVGLAGPWGEVTMGRLYSQLLWSILRTEPTMAQIYGTGAFELFLAAPRTDNAIAYRHKISDVSFGALYSFGRTAGDGAGACVGEAAGDRSNCRQWSAHASYDNPAGWGVGAWIDEANNAAGDQAFEYKGLNGYFTVAKVKLSANLLDVGSEVAAERKLWSIHAAYPITPQITVEGGYYDYDVDNTDDDSSMVNFRLSYAFSKRTAAYLTAARISNDGAATRSASIGVIGATPTGPGEDQTAVMIGLRHSF